MSKPVTIRPTSSVAASNASGFGLNAMVTAFLMFALGREFGGQENIPHDVLQVAPYIVAAIGGCCHFLADLWTRSRWYRKAGAVAGTEEPQTGGTP